MTRFPPRLCIFSAILIAYSITSCNDGGTGRERLDRSQFSGKGAGEAHADANKSEVASTGSDGGATGSETAATASDGGSTESDSTTAGSVAPSPEAIPLFLDLESFKIEGSLEGLVGGSLVIQVNAGESLTLTKDGKFAFVQSLPEGSPYNISIKAQPVAPDHVCELSDEHVGTIAGKNVDSLVIKCTPNAHSVSGQVKDLAGTGLKLKINNQEEVTVATDGSFTFPTKLIDRSTFTVTVSQTPNTPIQTCSASDESYKGTIQSADVTNVKFSCSTKAYTVSGNVKGLLGNPVVLSLGGESLSVPNDGDFAFTSPVASGSPYNVTVKSHPSQQTCTVGNGSGAITSADITNLAVVCCSQNQTPDSSGWCRFPPPFKSEGIAIKVVDDHLEHRNRTVRVHLGDFDGDGKTDVLRTWDDFSKNKLFLSTGSGLAEGVAVLDKDYLQHSNGTMRIHVGDFNGDGKADILHTRDSYKDNKIYISNGKGFNAGIPVLHTEEMHHSNGSVQIHLGDFNGDGKMDILRTGDDTNKNRLFLSTGVDFVNKGQIVVIDNHLHHSNNTVRVHIADFNGDGKADLLRTWDDKTKNKLFLSRGDGFDAGIAVLTNETLQHSNWQTRIHVADFDGDRKADIYRTGDDARLNAIFISTGSGFKGSTATSFMGGGAFQASFLWGTRLQYSNKSREIHLGDFNGDKKADILRTCDETEDNRLYLSGAQLGVFDAGPVSVVDNHLQHSNNTVRIHLGDFNGDGKTDLLRTWDDTSRLKMFMSEVIKY